MDASLQELLAWIGANPNWAYLAVFLAALGESVALIGLIVPGVLIMLGAGALIATGTLGFWPTALVAVAGAVLGDSLSFWLGRHYRDHMRQLWPFSRYPGQLERGIAFFDRYGGKSVAFGRFFGPGRAIIPLVAGMMHMPPRRFAVANIASAFAWAPAYLAPGILFGASLKLAAEAATRLVILLLVLVGGVWAAAWLARQIFWLLSPHAAAWLQALLHWGNVHPKIGRIAQALADSDHPDAAALAALAALLLAAAAVLGLLASTGLFREQELIINQIALDLGQSLHTPLADRIMLGLSRLGEAPVAVGLVTAVMLYLWGRGRGRYLGYWLAALAFALVATPLLGWLLSIPRPPLGLALAWPWSFPSAQALIATVVYGFLAVAVAGGLPQRWRWAPYAAATGLVAAVASARLYFGAEWLTDLVASLALGLAWVAALGIAFRRHTRLVHDWAGIAGVALLSGATAFTLVTLTQGHDHLADYQPARTAIEVGSSAWRAREELPVVQHREDLWRRNQRPFDVQYAGALETLRLALGTRGWQPPQMLTWHNAIRLLSPSLPLRELPVVPHVHAGRHEALVLAKDLADGSRRVLRLWTSGVRLDGRIHLWVGGVTELRKDTVIGLLVLPVTVGDSGRSNAALIADAADSGLLEVGPGRPVLLAPAASGLLGDPITTTGPEPGVLAAPSPAAAGVSRPSDPTGGDPRRGGRAPARP